MTKDAAVVGTSGEAMERRHWAEAATEYSHTGSLFCTSLLCMHVDHATVAPEIPQPPLRRLLLTQTFSLPLWNILPLPQWFRYPQTLTSILAPKLVLDCRTCGLGGLKLSMGIA